MPDNNGSAEQVSLSWYYNASQFRFDTWNVERYGTTTRTWRGKP